MSAASKFLLVPPFSVSSDTAGNCVLKQQATASASSSPRPKVPHKQLQVSLKKSKSSQENSSCQASSNFPVFTLFLRLPPEVRNMIWLHSLSPRIIMINHTPSYWSGLEAPKRPDIVRRRNMKESLPSLLSVCQESRTLVLPFYISIFPSPQLRPLRWHYTGRPPTRRPRLRAKEDRINAHEFTQPTNPKPRIKSLETI